MNTPAVTMAATDLKQSGRICKLEQQAHICVHVAQQDKNKTSILVSKLGAMLNLFCQGNAIRRYVV